MADTDEVPGRDASYLAETAREFGWRVVWGPDPAALMSKGAWTVRARFRPDGVLRHARARGPGSVTEELTLQQVVDTVEHWGSRNGEHEVPADVVNDLLDNGMDDGWQDDDSYDWTR